MSHVSQKTPINNKQDVGNGTYSKNINFKLMSLELSPRQEKENVFRLILQLYLY